MYQRGQEIEVRILDLDHESKKITLSAKDPSASPWSAKVGSEFVAGGTYDGKVVRMAPYGAFVELDGCCGGILTDIVTTAFFDEAVATSFAHLTAIDFDRRRDPESVRPLDPFERCLFTVRICDRGYPALVVKNDERTPAVFEDRKRPTIFRVLEGQKSLAILWQG
jgi:hypothetical protein